MEHNQQNPYNAQIPQKHMTIKITFIILAIIIVAIAIMQINPSPKTDVKSTYPERKYVSQDTNECQRTQILCVEGSEKFEDSTGCGCQPKTTQQKLTLCLDEQRNADACITLFAPVCATVDTNLRCITEPCPSTEFKTYSNSCVACSDENVLGYTEGECSN